MLYQDVETRAAEWRKMGEEMEEMKEEEKRKRKRERKVEKDREESLRDREEWVARAKR